MSGFNSEKKPGFLYGFFKISSGLNPEKQPGFFRAALFRANPEINVDYYNW